MAHDGQKIELDATVILSDLLSLTRDALPAVDDIVARATVAVRACLLYTSPSPRDLSTSRMPSSA